MTVIELWFAVNQKLQHGAIQLAHGRPHYLVDDGGSGFAAAAELDEAAFQVQVLARWIRALREHPHVLASPHDVHVEDGHIVARSPVPHDPGGGLRSDARECAERIAQGDVLEFVLNDML